MLALYRANMMTALWDLLVLVTGQVGAGLLVVGVVGFVFLAWVYTWLFQPSGTEEKSFPRGCCSDCGYDLTGNQSGRCPECGKRIRPPWMFR